MLLRFCNFGEWSSFIWLQHYCYNLAAYPSASDEPPSSAGLRGITAHKVYPIDALLQKPVSSYLTFSPLSSLRRTVIFCGPVSFAMVSVSTKHTKAGS